MPAQKKNFYDVVARPTIVRSQSGYVNKFHSAVWELHGVLINFGLLADAVTQRFLEDTKHYFATVINAQLQADTSFQHYFLALKDCVRFAFRGTGRKVNALTNAMIEEWSSDPSAAAYPYSLKLFINATRARDPKAFPSVTDKVLNSLRGSGQRNREYSVA